ncbi:hypothetical protein BC830DRAFT_447418 [Chytriomyces sp. MP71]|nr:hypothetical protein BC830DRAFT_447418 [Chytriomyces sp. MP71]
MKEGFCWTCQNAASNSCDTMSFPSPPPLPSRPPFVTHCFKQYTKHVKGGTHKVSGVASALASLNFNASNKAEDVVAYAASGLDDALDLLDLANKGTTVNNATKEIEKHPERRMKSAWAAFEEREMPILKAENPTLRLSQLKQLLQKKWKKSPENPLNMENVGAYNMTSEEARAAAADRREDALESMRVK